jgi:hypothetical protein
LFLDLLAVALEAALAEIEKSLRLCATQSFSPLGMYLPTNPQSRREIRPGSSANWFSRWHKVNALRRWTDDTHTYIQPAGEMTSIYTFIDGKPTLTMYHYMRGSETNVGTYVVDDVLNSGYLQLGKKSKLRFDRVKQ